MVPMLCAKAPSPSAQGVIEYTITVALIIKYSILIHTEIIPQKV